MDMKKRKSGITILNTRNKDPPPFDQSTKEATTTSSNSKHHRGPITIQDISISACNSPNKTLEVDF